MINDKVFSSIKEGDKDVIKIPIKALNQGKMEVGEEFGM